MSSQFSWAFGSLADELYCIVEEMRGRWGDQDKTGPVKNALREAKNGIRFYFTKPGHIVVPGLTGSSTSLEMGYARFQRGKRLFRCTCPYY